MTDYWSDDEFRLFIQPDGPGTELYPIICADIGDLDEPQGDVGREMCPDPAGTGHWNVALRTQGAPGEAPLQLTIPRGKTADYLDTLARTRCRTSFYYLNASCGRRDDFLPLPSDEDFSGSVARQGILTGKGRTGLGSRHADGGTPVGQMRTFSLSFEDFKDFFKLTPMRRTTTEDQILTGVAFYNDVICGGVCGAAQDACEYGAISSEAEVAVEAQVLLTTNGGTTWTAAAADPFAVAEDLGAIAISSLSSTTYRVIVARMGTVAATPAEIAYSDNWGVAWTTVSVGAVNTEFTTGPESMFMRTGDELWICTDTGGGAAGAIYRSRDGGLTWTLMFAAATDALNSIKFLDERTGIAVGDTNEILLTLDGGDTWSAITGPAAMAAVDALCCAMMSRNHWLIGYEGGQLYQTFNGGTSWAAVTLGATVGGAAVTSVNAIRSLKNVDDHCVFAAVEVTSGGVKYGLIMRCVTGGEDSTWESFETPIAVATLGLQGLHACHYDRAFGVGGVATTGMILEASHTA